MSGKSGEGFTQRRKNLRTVLKGKSGLPTKPRGKIREVIPSKRN